MICDHCAKFHADTRVYDDLGDDKYCPACRVGALEHGHLHGLHTDGTNEEPVEGCPSCAVEWAPRECGGCDRRWVIGDSDAEEPTEFCSHECEQRDRQAMKSRGEI